MILAAATGRPVDLSITSPLTVWADTKPERQQNTKSQEKILKLLISIF
jgi:hypothetical protein